jgi:3D (Asp-Asp-Asp) domain-containing protein
LHLGPLRVYEIMDTAKVLKVCLAIGCLNSQAAAAPASPSLNGRYVATAYAQTGITASGQWTHRHVVAADPDVLPIGTRIKIRHAGRYSGEYVVADTGAKVEGRRLDLYVPSTVECKKFGVKPVSVKVLELGNGTHQAAKQADQTVKEHVKQDVANGVVGDAATEHDWATKGAPVARAVKEGGTPADAAPQVLGGGDQKKPNASSTATSATPPR